MIIRFFNVLYIVENQIDLKFAIPSNSSTDQVARFHRAFGSKFEQGICRFVDSLRFVVSVRDEDHRRLIVRVIETIEAIERRGRGWRFEIGWRVDDQRKLPVFGQFGLLVARIVDLTYEDQRHGFSISLDHDGRIWIGYDPSSTFLSSLNTLADALARARNLDERDFIVRASSPDFW